MKHLPMKQQGFTLLELLVVITLLAVLSVGALVAYEGVGDTAQATAQANNTATTDKAIRNYRAVTGKYPNQWDNLSLATGGAINSLAPVSRAFFGELNLAAISGTSEGAAIVAALKNVGIEELQQYDAEALGVAPNLQHNEGANTDADEAEIDDDVSFISIVPTGVEIGGVGTQCEVAGQSISTTYAGTTVNNALVLNKINDALEDDACHLVLALGFGHDAAHSTFDSSVAIAAAPTFASKDINPSTNYARYIALFHVGSGDDGEDEVEDFRESARLIAVVAPDGTAIDEALAKATSAN